MSISVNFYTFNKKKNSTKLPGGASISYSCILKDNTSILNPSLLIDRANPTNLNYCYIPSFNRYYFITDWVSDHNMWIANCSCDVLASWRSNIRSSRQYVVRSSSKYNTYIADSMYPGTLKKTYSEHTFASNEKCFNSANYSYVIGVMNGTPNAQRLGGVTYYVVTSGQLQTLMNAMFGDASYLGDSQGLFPTLFGITEEVMKALVNPTQYIVDSYLLPYSIPYTVNSPFTVGWWGLPGFDQNVACVQVQNMVYRNVFYTQDYAFENHPQISRGAYMNGAPFHNMRISAGPFGDVEIDTSMLVYTTNRINLEVAGDYMGNVELIIRGEPTNQIITRREASVKIPFKIGQMYQDRIGMMKNTMNQFAGGVSGGLGLVKGDASGMVGYGNAILDGFEASAPKVNVIGSNESLYDVNRSWILQQEFTHCVDDDYSQKGKPLCEDLYLSELNGYCVIDSPEIEFHCYESEYDQIMSYMINGFFLE